MNCLEFRNQWLADPYHLGSDAGSHRDECEHCRQFVDDRSVYERGLAKALATPVEDTLADRILLQTSLKHQRPGWQRPVVATLALAASLLLAVGLYLKLPGAGQPQIADAAISEEAFAESMIEHIAHEPASLLRVQPAQRASLTKVLSRLGYAWQGDSQKVTYVRFCDLHGQPAAHIVVASDAGPVTVMLMPGEMAVPKGAQYPSMQQFGAWRMRAVALANGSTAVFALKDQQDDGLSSRSLQEVEQAISQQIVDV